MDLKNTKYMVQPYEQNCSLDFIYALFINQTFNLQYSGNYEALSSVESILNATECLQIKLMLMSYVFKQAYWVDH